MGFLGLFLLQFKKLFTFKRFLDINFIMDWTFYKIL